MFREQIRKYYVHLSRSYRRVADFILTDYQTAAFMTAAGLAEAVDVDTTTVVRFAQRLGYPGFPELIEDIQQQVKSELAQSYLAAPGDDTRQANIQRLVVHDRNCLEKALAHNTLDSLEALLDLLREASRIVVVGESYAAPLAESFASMLRDAGLPATYVGGDVYERAVALAALARKEAVVGLSPLTGPSGVAQALSFARDEGAVTLACTPDLCSQVARSAEYILYAPGETEGSIPSLVGLYSFCTAIARTLEKEAPNSVSKRSAEVKRALEELS
jgi:DNA-binding MurR/RpiR family transcriptional regulator